MTVLTPPPFHASEPLPEQVHFDRHELGAILRLYGQMVAAGEWRDYGISALREAAVAAPAAIVALAALKTGRPVRWQLELLKPQLVMDERGINSTVVMFGGARIPAPENRESAKTPYLAELSQYYEEARKFAEIITNRF